jgi:hypothetical protein
MIDPKIMKRIQKLMSLGANNDQVHEANNAMKKAAQLAEEHGLALSDVNQETGEVSSVKKGSVDKVHSRHSCWVNSLAVVVGECFDCKPIMSGRSMIFVGTPTDLEMTIWYYKLIRLKTIRGASTKYDLVADQKMYGRGVLATMQTRLTEMFVKEQEKIRTPTTTALVLVKNEAVQEEVERLYPKLRKSKASYKMNGSAGAYRQGMNDGATMTLHRGTITA